MFTIRSMTNTIFLLKPFFPCHSGSGVNVDRTGYYDLQAGVGPVFSASLHSYATPALQPSFSICKMAVITPLLRARRWMRQLLAASGEGPDNPTRAGSVHSLPPKQISQDRAHPLSDAPTANPFAARCWLYHSSTGRPPISACGILELCP